MKTSLACLVLVVALASLSSLTEGRSYRNAREIIDKARRMIYVPRRAGQPFPLSSSAKRESRDDKMAALAEDAENEDEDFEELQDGETSDEPLDQDEDEDVLQPRSPWIRFRFRKALKRLLQRRN